MTERPDGNDPSEDRGQPPAPDGTGSTEPTWSSPDPSAPPPPPPPGPYQQGPYQQGPYQQGPYAQGPYQQPYGPGYGPGAGPTTPSLPAGMAVTAMVIAILAVTVAWIPFLGVLGLVGGIVGVVLGIMARRRVSAGRAGGGGMALTGVITGAVAILFGIGSTLLAIAIIRSEGSSGSSTTWDFETDWNLDPEEPDEDQAFGRELSVWELDTIDSYGIVEAGQTARLGENGRTASVLAWDLTADDRITTLEGMYPAEAGRYVLVEIELGNEGPDAYRASDLDIAFVGGDLRTYLNSCRWWAPESPVYDAGEIRTGEAVTVEACFDVPEDAVDGGRLLVRDYEAWSGPAGVWEVE